MRKAALGDRVAHSPQMRGRYIDTRAASSPRHDAYCTRKEMDLEMRELTGFLASARETCGMPIAVGFSISTREQVEALGGHADIAVVGTHFIRVWEEGGTTALEAELNKLTGS